MLLDKDYVPSNTQDAREHYSSIKHALKSLLLEIEENKFTEIYHVEGFINSKLDELEVVCDE